MVAILIIPTRDRERETEGTWQQPLEAVKSSLTLCPRNSDGTGHLSPISDGMGHLSPYLTAWVTCRQSCACILPSFAAVTARRAHHMSGPPWAWAPHPFLCPVCICMCQHSGSALKRWQRTWWVKATTEQMEGANHLQVGVQWEQFWLWSQASLLLAWKKGLPACTVRSQIPRTGLLNSFICDRKLQISVKQLSLMILNPCDQDWPVEAEKTGGPSLPRNTVDGQRITPGYPWKETIPLPHSRAPFPINYIYWDLHHRLWLCFNKQT